MTIGQGKVRIIGGYWRGRQIAFPDRPDLRPTTDRIRETVFNWLGQHLDGLSCLDLFAGSGALGFEAASRGAEQVVMVETDTRAYQALHENKQKFQAMQVELFLGDALSFIHADARKFDVIFLDPPYRLGLLPKLLPLLPSHLEKNGRVYTETKGIWVPDKQWQAKHSGKAGEVYYQLLEIRD